MLLLYILIHLLLHGPIYKVDIIIIFIQKKLYLLITNIVITLHCKNMKHKIIILKIKYDTIYQIAS